MAAAFLALSGSALIGVAMASQHRPPAAPAMTVSVQAPVQPAGHVEAARQDAVQEPVNIPDSAVADSVHMDAAMPVVSPMSPAEPLSIDIPAIGVSSVVRHLGQAANGSLEVPSGAQYNDAAWYRHSPTPGALGPAVILGHVDSAAQGPSVFFRLGELQPGHRVTISRADGSVAVFVVDAVHRYAKADFPTQVVYSDIDHAGLRILTCGGAFDEAAGSYLDNVVVFAALVGGA